MPGWNTREDLAERLVEELGFSPDPECPTLMWNKGSVQWSIIDGYGNGVLQDREGLWTAPFNPKVPTHIVLGAAREAAADCKEHGTDCDHHAPDVTVNGEVV